MYSHNYKKILVLLKMALTMDPYLQGKKSLMACPELQCTISENTTRGELVSTFAIFKHYFVS
jgi:hypothetical protein